MTTLKAETFVVHTLRWFMKGKSQKEIAKRLEISPQYLCDVLQGRRGLSVELAVKLHTRLGWHVNNARELWMAQADELFDVALAEKAEAA